MRFVFALFFLVLATACGFGWLASAEPGVAPIWQVGYGAGAILFVLLMLRSLFKRRAKPKTA